jgi:predicted HAD superfamily Cof-like phosphohydrolase
MMTYPSDATQAEDREFLMVRTLYRRFGFIESAAPTHLTKRKLKERIVMMREEVNEFVDAVERQDLAGMADALVDLVVFAKGTASMMGLPWRALFDDVDRANSTKVRGPTKRGFRDDITKPPGWVGPRTDNILAAAGYDRRNFTTNFVVDEAKCLDDPLVTPARTIKAGDRVKIISMPKLSVGGEEVAGIWGVGVGVEATVRRIGGAGLYEVDFDGGSIVWLADENLELVS